MNLDLFTPSQLPYPGIAMAAGGCASQTAPATLGSGAVQSPPRDGIINSIFTPDDLPYPLPIFEQGFGNGSQSASCGCTQSQAASAAGLPTAAPSVPAPVSSAPPAASVSPPTAASPAAEQAPATPSQIVINVGVPAAATTAQPAQPATSSTPVPSPQTPPDPVSAPPAAPPIAPSSTAAVMRSPMMFVSGGTPPQPSDVIVQAYSLNPRLRARIPKAQEELLEELLQEKITMRMLSGNATPLAFQAPDGCNAVELFTGAIEENPDIGTTDDLDLIITIGALKLGQNVLSGSGPLRPGDQITVTVPWRYASWVELAQEHLRVPVTARFFSIENA